MIRLTSSGTVGCSAKDLRRLQIQFEKNHCVRLPGLLGPGLLRTLQDQFNSARFDEKSHPGIGLEYCMRHNPAAALLQFLTNNPTLFQLVQQMTQCGPLGFFQARVYRMIPGRGHFDAWHDDMTENRMAAMSINLSPEPYQGGFLQIRDRTSKKILHEIANVGSGDAVLFRISNLFQHRVRPVKGNVPKTAYAGWFRSKPDFRFLLNKKISSRPVSAHPQRTNGITLRSRLERTDEAAYQIEKEGAVLLHMKSGLYYKLNESGKRLWELLIRKEILPSAVNILMKEYHVPRRICEQDAVNVLCELQAAGFLKNRS